MVKKKAKPPSGEGPDNPLLTPGEREALRAAPELRKQSEEIVERVARVTRPKAFTGRFPQQERRGG